MAWFEAMNANTDLQLADPADSRLTELEIKASFAEDLLDQLNAVIVRQQQQIDALVREVQQLREQQPNASASGAARLTDDLPPHY
jgi:SlyX protein